MSGLLLGLFAALGVLCGWVAFFRTNRLQRQITELQSRLERLQKNIESGIEKGIEGGRLASEVEGNNLASENLGEKPVLSEGLPAAPALSVPHAHSEQTVMEGSPPVGANTMAPQPLWLEHVREHWMSWLGGTCVGLAGIFLVRYSIEQGLLGPSARIALAVLLGLGLHVAAGWLRLRKGAHPSLGALAAGGSITLFAATLAALHLYQLFSPTFAFIVLAAVALATMWLALLQGPVLAILGILGAYTVPLLVGGGADNANTVLLYVLVISAAALLLLRHVDRLWLWAGVLTGGAAWWWLTLAAATVELTRGWYLAAFIWLLYAISVRDWLLSQFVSATNAAGILRYCRPAAGRERVLAVGLAAAVLAFAISITITRFDDSAFLMWTPFTLLVLYLAGRRQHLVLHAWMLLALTWLAWFAQALYGPPLIGEELAAFYWYCLNSSLVVVVLALRNARQGDWRPWLPMLLLAPLGFLLLSWLLTADTESSLQWTLLAALLGAIYLALAAQALREQLSALASAWFFIATHLAYSLAVAMYLREASMTLALSVQLISLGWVVRRFELPGMGWLLKGVVAAVLCRLSLNPWLFQYPDDVHWSLWTYGGATLSCWLGSRQLQNYPELQAWLRAASVHLLTLTIWAELRYWLYDGAVFSAQYSAIEAGLNAGILAALGLVYHWREQFSHRLARLYRLYSQVLLVLALGNYMVVLLATRASAFWVTSAVGETWLLNSMWLLYGLPVVMAYASARWYLPVVRPVAFGIAAVGAFVFISLQIRHFWQASVSLQPPVLDAELYTYSAVWLLLAVAAMLAGAWRYGQHCYRAGMLLLLLVVAKLFLVDMSGLQGLLRVASFLGMGLGLLGVAYLHRKLQPQSAAIADASRAS